MHMATGYIDVNLETQYTDTFPLLMDQNAPAINSEHDHVVSVSITQPGSDVPTESSKCPQAIADVSNSHGHVAVAIDHASAAATGSSSTQGHTSYPYGSFSGRSSSTSSRLHLLPAEGSSRRSRSSGQNRDPSGYGTRQPINPLNSGLWISIEAAVTVIQIIASIVVLSLSRHEKPRAPLALWIMGYAAGCVAMLPLLYWRYKHHHRQEQDPEPVSSSVTASSPSTRAGSGTSQTGLEHMSEGEESENVVQIPDDHQVSSDRESRNAVRMERFKIALDCFFAVWFVVGNVWIFGGHSSSHEAPNLYRLSIVFLTFSCISYAMPFVICATVCCCLPCIVTLLSYREDQAQMKGATPEVIKSLPIYKFKTKGPTEKSRKDENDSDTDSVGEGGIFAPGTDKERVVSGEDAVCCICLGAYKDGVDLKELHCSHFFHVECVDKWLKINATCPLCKDELASAGGNERE